jgi:hypothetical protein
MGKITCKICGATSDEKSLYHESFSRNLDGYHCWTCYHKQAVELNTKGFGCGTVGENSGWIDDYTFAEAVEYALSEIELENNIDMGIRVGGSIDTGYYSAAIVRNHQLYVKVAELHHSQSIDI